MKCIFCPQLTPEQQFKVNRYAPPPLSSRPTRRLRPITKPIRVDVDLVLVPVTVNDPMNRLVIGLEKDHFALFDNGQRTGNQVLFQ